MSQGDDKELVQPSVRQHLQNVSQPDLLLQTSVSFLRYLHDLPQLSSELWPLVHFLSPPHPSAAWSPSVDWPALHRLHEDAFSGGDVSHTMRTMQLSPVTVRILYFRSGKHLSKPQDFFQTEAFVCSEGGASHKSVPWAKHSSSTLQWPTSPMNSLEGAADLARVKHVLSRL